MASKVLSFLLLLLASVAAAAGPVNITGSRDITKVLDQFPNFSTLNKLLTQTKVADQINSRQTITLLAVADSAMSSLTGLPADVQEKVLSLHVVLDYYDIDKITNLPNATALLTTLFQASGKAVGKAGFLNATYVGDGQIKLGSAVDGILTSDVIREIAMQPHIISVIEVSKVVIPTGIASGGNASQSAATGSATPSPAPKAEDTPAPPKEAPVSPPKEAPVSPPKAAPTPKPSPSAVSPSPKSNSSDDSPAPAATDGPVSSPVSSAPTPSSTAPTAEAPAGPADATAGSADAPAGPADAPVGSADTPVGSSDVPAGSPDAPPADHTSSASCLTVGAGIGAAIGAAFLAAL